MRLRSQVIYFERRKVLKDESVIRDSYILLFGVSNKTKNFVISNLFLLIQRKCLISETMTFLLSFDGLEIFVALIK